MKQDLSMLSHVMGQLTAAAVECLSESTGGPVKLVLTVMTPDGNVHHVANCPVHELAIIVQATLAHLPNVRPEDMTNVTPPNPSRH